MAKICQHCRLEICNMQQWLSTVNYLENKMAQKFAKSAGLIASKMIFFNVLFPSTELTGATNNCII